LVRLVVVLLVALAATACEDVPAADATPSDATVAAPDGARPDATMADADGDRPDARPPDAAMPDAAPRHDAADLDAATAADAGAADAALPDAAPRDAMPPPLPDAADVPYEFICYDHLDNDEDGRPDCEDPDCRGLGGCFDAPEHCDNGRDDNGDDRVDCDDVLCLGRDACPVPDVAPFTDDEVQSLLEANCMPCHFPPAPDALMDLTAPFEGVTIGVVSTEVPPMLRIAPGDRQASYLFRKVAYSFRGVGGGEGMPPEQPLPAADVERLGRWIDALPRQAPSP
jgi:hypothetical protein